MFLFSLILSSYADIPQTSKWVSSPDIVICEDSTVSVEDVTSAVKFWEAKGHKFGSIEYVDDCLDYHSGYILFVGDENLSSKYAGMTDLFEYGGNISSAYIEVWSGARKDLKVIAHELGHAIGYEHVNNTYNIMYKCAPDANVTIRR
jgi:hypothetical protein